MAPTRTSQVELSLAFACLVALGGACSSLPGGESPRPDAGPPVSGVPGPSDAARDREYDGDQDSVPAPPADTAPLPSADAAPVDGAFRGPDTSSSGDAARLAGTVKIMILGSSNELDTCWRAFVWQKLRAAGITNFDFVGAQNAGPDCGVAGYDKDTESRSGNRITSYNAAQWTAMFRGSSPDIVLTHVGGADLLDGVPPARVVEAHALAFNQARALNPLIRFMVGQHTPMEPSRCTDCRAKVTEFNAALADWAAQTSTPATPVTAVDLFTGIDVVADTTDRVHLNMSGSQKVSDRWVAALLPLLEP